MPDTIKRQEAIDAILFSLTMYYQVELEHHVIEIYHELLTDYDDRDIAVACKSWMKQSRWFPKVSEIIEIIECNKAPSVSIEALSQQQWRIVMDAVRKYGARRPPTFADPITANLVATQFRWTYLCDIDEANENWEQKRWERAYELAAEMYGDMIRLPEPAKVMALADTVGVHVK